MTIERPTDESLSHQLGEISLEEAQHRAGDHDARLLGESTEDVVAKDAEHWIGVYGELVQFKHDILDVLRSRRSHMSVDAHIEGGTDEVLIRHQLERYERRHQEWQTALSRLMDGSEGLGAGLPLLVESGPVRLGQLEIDPRQRIVIQNGARHILTPTEWKLLRVFLERPGVVLGREELAGEAWGAAYRERQSEVEVYISRLRRKLELPGGPPLLETVRGRGYRLVVPPATLPPAYRSTNEYKAIE